MNPLVKNASLSTLLVAALRKIPSLTPRQARGISRLQRFVIRSEVLYSALERYEV
jgi:hypothetical protein